MSFLTVPRPRVFLFLGLFLAASNAGAATSSKAPPKSGVPAPSSKTPAAAKVVLLGLDAADWTLIDPLIAEGKMPNLARVVSEGRTAVMKSELPYLSPILWSTLATGVPPPQHQVLDFEEFDPADGDRVPISARSRDFPAIWSTASAHGLDVGVVGWWASWPCEQVRGFCISDRFAPALFEAPPDGPGLVHPEVQLKSLTKLRTEEIATANSDAPRVFGYDAGALARLGPSGAKTSEGLRRVLAQSRIFVRSALTLGQRVHPSLLAVYLSGTDEVGHVAAKWHPPRLAGLSDDEFLAFSGAVSGFYQETDRLIGQVADFARAERATLIIVSDHGFRWGRDRPAVGDSDAWNTAAYWHTSEGIFIVSGERAGRGARGKMNPYDLSPTISALLGLPVDRKMTGKVLVEFFERGALRGSAAADLRKDVPVRLAPTGAPSHESHLQAQAQREKLRSLGYLTGAETGKPLAVDPSGRPGKTEGAWNNLGLFLKERGRRPEAAEAFRKSLQIRPAYSSPLYNLSMLLFDEKKWGESDEKLFESIAAGNPRAEAIIEKRIADYSKKGVPPAQLGRFLDLAAKRAPGSRNLVLLNGRRKFESRDCAAAAKIFDGYLAERGEDVEILNLSGVSHLCLEDREGAADRFRRSLVKDPAQTVPKEALRQIEAASR